MDTIDATADDAITRATAALDAGELVIVPLDLHYVLAADALDDAAVERLFLATGRGADQELTIVVSGYEDLHHVAYGGANVRALAEAHWPGAVSFALTPRPWLPDAVVAGAEGVHVTAPAQAFARTLARHFGPLAIASAGARSRSLADAARAVGREAMLGVDAGTLPGGEAKVIRDGTPARP